jgi:hypothetical protein
VAILKFLKFGFQVDYDVAFGSHIISYLVVFAPFLIMSPKQSFRRHIVFALFLIEGGHFKIFNNKEHNFER